MSSVPQSWVSARRFLRCYWSVSPLSSCGCRSSVPTTRVSTIDQQPRLQLMAMVKVIVLSRVRISPWLTSVLPIRYSTHSICLTSRFHGSLLRGGPLVFSLRILCGANRYAPLLALNSTLLIPTRCPHCPHQYHPINEHVMHPHNNSNSLCSAVAVSIPVTHRHHHHRHHCGSHSAGRSIAIRIFFASVVAQPQQLHFQHLAPVENWTKSRLSERSANSLCIYVPGRSRYGTGQT